MARVKPEDVEKFKKIMKKEHGYEFATDDEAAEAARNLVDFVELLYDMYREEEARKRQLIDSPKGFEIESNGRTCSLCGHGVFGSMWYDKWGMKCMDCQAALNKKIVPGYVFTDIKNEKHITASTLSWKMSIRQQSIRKLVNQGKLKPRVVPSSAGDTFVFLRRDNPDLASIIQAELESNLKARAR